MVMKIKTLIFVKIKTGKITRGHDFALVKGQSTLYVSKYYLNQMTPNELWNNVLAECVHSRSINMINN